MNVNIGREWKKKHSSRLLQKRGSDQWYNCHTYAKNVHLFLWERHLYACSFMIISSYTVQMWRSLLQTNNKQYYRVVAGPVRASSQYRCLTLSEHSEWSGVQNSGRSNHYGLHPSQSGCWYWKRESLRCRWCAGGPVLFKQRDRPSVVRVIFSSWCQVVLGVEPLTSQLWLSPLSTAGSTAAHRGSLWHPIKCGTGLEAETNTALSGVSCLLHVS